jgi:signal transduction histidine kinase
VAETGEPAMDIEWALRTASGETLWLEVNATLAEISGERRVVTIARDITGRRDREERVQVLNRVLRHNVRNDMDAVIGYATAVEDVAERERAEEHARQVREIAEDLLALSGKARAAGRMLRDHDRRETRPVGAVLESVVADVRDAHGNATVEVACETANVPVEAGVFRLVVRELVENAVNHAGDAPSIEVRATPAADGDGPTVTVRDDGPGIPDRVLTPFRAGGETQFRHNHGIGLWLVNWGVRRLGGRIEFERPTDGGTIARLHLPDRGS